MTDEINTSKIGAFWVLRCELDEGVFYLCQTIIGQRYLSDKLECLLGDILHFEKLAQAKDEARAWNSQLQAHEEYFRVKPVRIYVCIQEFVENENR